MIYKLAGQPDAFCVILLMHFINVFFCQVLCQLSFWLLLRQTLMERREKMKEDEPLSDVKVEEQKKGLHLFQSYILKRLIVFTFTVNLKL